MDAWVKFREAANAIGFWNAVLFAASRACTAVFGARVRIIKYYFMAQPIVPPAQGRWPRTGTFELSWVGENCPLFRHVERPPETLRSRFNQGSRCLLATKEGNLAGFLWFVPGPYEEDEVRARFVPMPSGEAVWDFDVMVMPQFRMGRLFSYLWARANTELAAGGVRHTMSRISAFNPASLASHQRLGARMVGSALFLCLGHWQLMRSSLIPHWHLSRGRDDRPSLNITTPPT